MIKIELVTTQKNRRLADYVENRLELAVGRHTPRIEKIQVHIVDENGGKGGQDITCTMDANIVPRGRLHVRATECTVREAIDKAAHRLTATVSKLVSRSHRGRAIRHAHGGLRHENERLVEAVDR